MWEKIKRFLAGFIAGIIAIGGAILIFVRSKGNNQSPKPDDRQLDESLDRSGQAIDRQGQAIDRAIDVIGDDQERKLDAEKRNADTIRLLAEAEAIRQRARKFLEDQRD